MILPNMFFGPCQPILHGPEESKNGRGSGFVADKWLQQRSSHSACDSDLHKGYDGPVWWLE